MAWYNPKTWGDGKAAPEVQTRLINSFAGFELAMNGGFAAQPSEMWAYRGMLSIPGVWRAATLIANTVAALPQQAYRYKPGGEITQVPYILLDQPSYPHTRVDVWSSLVLDLVMHGNAFAVIATRNAAGVPTSIIPIPAVSVGVRWTEDGSIEYWYRDQTYTVNEVLHIRGPHQPGDLRGYGVLEQHMITLRTAQDLSEQARDISKGVPSGLLKSMNPDLTAEEAADLKATWRESQEHRTVAVLNATTDFQPLGWNPTDAQLLETRHFSLTEIALIFGIPSHFLLAASGKGSETYSNVQQEAMSLVKYALHAYISRIEQALSNLLPNGTQVKLSLDSLLRADTLTRYQAHQLAITSGWMTVNEVRAVEDLPPLPGGDTPTSDKNAAVSDPVVPAPGIDSWEAPTASKANPPPITSNPVQGDQVTPNG